MDKDKEIEYLRAKVKRLETDLFKRISESRVIIGLKQRLSKREQQVMEMQNKGPKRSAKVRRVRVRRRR